MDLSLRAVTPEGLVRALPEVAMPLADARKLVSAAHRGVPFDAIQGVRRASIEAARALPMPELPVQAARKSSIDPFLKLAFDVEDGAIEAVRIPLERAGRFSVCVSSQVGCALACAFCATGRMGLTRNLEVWEIVEQVRAVKSTLSAGERVHGVVFQGMGEPLANADRVLAAIQVLRDPSALAIDARAMTVCTAGIPSGIRRLAREAPKVRLGLSIATARRGARKSLMPIDAANPLEEVIDAVVEHARATGLAPMWAVTLLAGVNDSDDDARALAELATSFAERAGVRPRVSVIPYNAISAHDDPFARTSDEREARFRAVLGEHGFGSHKRYSGGADVDAACGQLAARVAPAAAQR
jgi:23S rRNA (adenine2503-C2)-methyltransferase